MQNSYPHNILIIKLSALGDFVQALGHIRAIREHHKDAHITLMTTKAFAGFGLKSGYVDDVLLDPRPKFFQLSRLMKLRHSILSAHFDRVYDLQNNDRTKLYMCLFQSFTHKPKWASTHKGAKFRNVKFNKANSHAFERHKETLRVAGVENVSRDNLAWMKEDITKFSLPNPYALLVPGSAPSRPEKRWPAEYYAEIAIKLHKQKIKPVIIGTASEEAEARKIQDICPDILNLCGKTSLYDLPSLGREAQLVLGNDTGPMHLIAATNVPCVVLFSSNSDPYKHAPMGDNVHVIRSLNLSDLKPGIVWQKIEKL